MGDRRCVLERGRDGWPGRVDELDRPPGRLFVVGDPAALGCAGLAVIGARKATPYGLSVAEMAGRIAAECGIVVISGGAYGCDAAALRGAQGAGGLTVIVSGTGADRPYPDSSRDLFEHASREGGCVVSLEPWGSPPLPYTFPKRNRIIAALCHALLVAEAGERTGTSSTADAAAELGRHVYAVPGSIFSPESLGANRLIASGAAIIASEEDLEVQISLDFGVSRLVCPGLDRHSGRIMSALVASPMRPDDLANRLGMPALEVLRALADYEAIGMVSRLPDGRYSPSRDLFLGNARMGGEKRRV